MQIARGHSRVRARCVLIQRGCEPVSEPCWKYAGSGKRVHLIVLARKVAPQGRLEHRCRKVAPPPHDPGATAVEQARFGPTRRCRAAAAARCIAPALDTRGAAVTRRRAARGFERRDHSRAEVDDLGDTERAEARRLFRGQVVRERDEGVRRARTAEGADHRSGRLDVVGRGRPVVEDWVDVGALAAREECDVRPPRRRA